jgi:hypothetical protein
MTLKAEFQQQLNFNQEKKTTPSTQHNSTSRFQTSSSPKQPHWLVPNGIQSIKKLSGMHRYTPAGFIFTG